MPVPAAILELIDRFARNLPDYKQGRYNETQVRREFIDPFFEALGWDVNNKQGYAEAAQHHHMVQLVERMLDLNRQLAETAAPHAKTILARQIAATDREIDQLVYQLYHLTPAEIAIVEGGA
jgi:hypothetical protein